MNLTLRLRFTTKPGQSLWVAGEGSLPAQLPMHFLDNESWQVSLKLTAVQAQYPLVYSYVLRSDDGSKVTDWGRDRAFIPTEYYAEDLLVIDSWNAAGFTENAFYTEPFKRVLFARNNANLSQPPKKSATHTFRVKAPLLKKGQTLCLLGDGPLLGNWETQSPILMSRQSGQDYFSVQLDLRGHAFPSGYKYGLFDVAGMSFLGFETGINRVLADGTATHRHTIVNDGFARLPATPWRGAGVAIPVFSLRSDNGFGTGEFLDLKALADWGKKAGLKLIQLLPVNDTSATHTWKDSYPYAAISAFALHPLYLNLRAVANAKNQRLLKALEPERLRLNALPEVDYEAVMRAKLGLLRDIFPSQKAATFRGKDYNSFFGENRHWLVPYAAFCCFRDQYGTPDCRSWPEHQEYDERIIEQLAETSDAMAFHFFVQFHLHQQLSEATAHAHAAGLVVKGDIAIGVYRYGADTWQSPELFHMDCQAGAPPDPFAAKGQNWGFPTYNWSRMAADGFGWWKQRFTQMGNYFDAFRIDHILGFFRIWTIPTNAVEGILGHFVPAIPLTTDEFIKLGVHYDHKRFTQPFITEAVLTEIFSDKAAQVGKTFLTAQSHGNYTLKPQFASQQEVEKHFATLPADERHARLKIGLFDLISNVILLEREGKLHFRFAMEQTPSFQHLPAGARAALKDLYVDYFFRRQDEFWKKEAWQKLPALKRVTNMLICGEDLGLVPACVPEVMRDLGFLSLEIQRMPKAFGMDFSRPSDAPYLSVVTPSTHDMSTIRGWWTEDRKLTQTFFNRELGQPGEAPAEASPEVVAGVLRQHLASPAMWSIFQLQDLLGMDGQLRRPDVATERINIPANPIHYWRYRVHLKLEDLLAADEFNRNLGKMIQENGR